MTATRNGWRSDEATNIILNQRPLGFDPLSSNDYGRRRNMAFADSANAQS